MSKWIKMTIAGITTVSFISYVKAEYSDDKKIYYQYNKKGNIVYGKQLLKVDGNREKHAFWVQNDKTPIANERFRHMVDYEAKHRYLGCLYRIVDQSAPKYKVIEFDARSEILCALMRSDGLM